MAKQRKTQTAQPLMKKAKQSQADHPRQMSLKMFCLEVVVGPMTPCTIHLIRHVQSAKAKRNPQGGNLVDAWIASAFHLVTERRDGMPECLGRRLDGIIRLIFCTDVGCRHLETRLHHILPQD